MCRSDHCHRDRDIVTWRGLGHVTTVTRQHFVKPVNNTFICGNWRPKVGFESWSRSINAHSGTNWDSIEQRTFKNIVTGQVGLGNEASDRWWVRGEAASHRVTLGGAGHSLRHPGLAGESVLQRPLQQPHPCSILQSWGWTSYLTLRHSVNITWQLMCTRHNIRHETDQGGIE